MQWLSFTGGVTIGLIAGLVAGIALTLILIGLANSSFK